MTALHRKQRYLRTSTSPTVASPPSSSGPSRIRVRAPCPCSRSGSPGGAAATPQQGQWLGLAAETDGRFFVQLLTSPSK